MTEIKNKSAVHLGRVSAQKRREKLGEEGFKKAMSSLRKMRDVKKSKEDDKQP